MKKTWSKPIQTTLGECVISEHVCAAAWSGCVRGDFR